MVNAVANSTVPKFSIVMGNSYGAGNYAMCGKAYDPRLIVAWPTAKIAVMGGDQAAKVLLQIQASAMKAHGKELTEKEKEELLAEIRGRYEDQRRTGAGGRRSAILAREHELRRSDRVRAVRGRSDLSERAWHGRRHAGYARRQHPQGTGRGAQPA